MWYFTSLIQILIINLGVFITLILFLFLFFFRSIIERTDMLSETNDAFSEPFEQS
jgi:hypothetical protein